MSKLARLAENCRKILVWSMQYIAWQLSSRGRCLSLLIVDLNLIDEPSSSSRYCTSFARKIFENTELVPRLQVITCLVCGHVPLINHSWADIMGTQFDCVNVGSTEVIKERPLNVTKVT